MKWILAARTSVVLGCAIVARGHLAGFGVVPAVQAQSRHDHEVGNHSVKKIPKAPNKFATMTSRLEPRSKLSEPSMTREQIVAILRSSLPPRNAARAADQVSGRSDNVADDSAEALALKGQVLLSRGAISEASSAFEQAFKSAEASGNVHAQVVALRGSGASLRYQGLNRMAEEKLQTALRLTNEGSMLQAEILSDMALVYSAQDDYTKAREALTKASRILAAAADTSPAERAPVAAGVGLGCLQSALRSCAERYIRNASSAAPSSQETLPFDSSRILMAALGAGRVEVVTSPVVGDSFGERVGDATSLARDLRKAGNNCLELGLYSDGLRSLTIAKFLFQAIGDVEDTNSTTIDIALGYLRLGAPSKTIHAIEGGNSILARGPYHQQVRALWALGLAHLELASGQNEHWSSALEVFSKMRSLGEAAKDSATTAMAADKEAVVLQNRDGIKASLPLFARGRELARRTDPITEARVLNDMGRSYLAAGELSAAEAVLRESLAKLDAGKQYRTRAAVLENLGALLEKKGKLRESIDMYVQAISILDEYRGIPPEIGFQRSSDDPYRPLVRLLMSSGRTRDAFAVAERARNVRQYPPAQASVSTSDPDSGSDNVLDSMLLERIVVERRIGSERASDPESRARVDQLMNRYAVIVGEYETVLRRVEVAGTMVRPLSRSARPIELEQLQKTLTEDMALLSYFDTGDVVYGFGIRRSAFVGFEVRLTSATIAQLVSEIPGRSLSASQKALQQLYDLLVNPVRHLAEAPTIIFVPSASLCSLPFGALMNDDRYLIDDHTVYVLPSAGAFVTPRQSLPAGRGLVVLSDKEEPSESLSDGVRREAIATRYGGLPVMDSTKSGFFAHAPLSAVVHISAKTVLDSTEIQSSRIVLSRDEGPDETIAPYELRDLNLSRVGLVVLSNSEGTPEATSFGEEGMVFPNVFSAAGAAAVVTSRWPVPPDATDALLASFFENLMEGQGRAAALRKAELIVRQTYPWPSIWAGFGLVGDPGILAATESLAAKGTRLTGVVQQVEWPFLLVKNRDGSTLRIHCLPETRLHKGGELASPAILQPGAQVVVNAAVDSEARFAATDVEVLVSPAVSSNSLQIAGPGRAANDPFLRAAAEKARIEAGKLPKFNAPFVTDRSVSSDDGLFWNHTDTVSGEIVYIVGKGEVIRDLTLGRTPWKRGIMELDGFVTTGDYSALSALFNSSVGGRFQFKGEDMLAGSPVFMYDYVVPEATTNLSLTDFRQVVRTGYHGTVWIDKVSLWVWKIRYTADEEIPLSFPWRRVVTEINFDLMDMKAGGRFLLPKSHNEVMCWRDAGKCSRNETVFHDYQQFISRSKICWSESSEKCPESEKESSAAVRTGSLIWTGDLAPYETLTIEAKPSSGALSGAPLPGTPVKIATIPPLAVFDEPAARNQWRRIALKNGSKHIRRIEIHWQTQP